MSTYLLENGFKRGTIDKTLFIKKDKGDILLVHVYVDDIIFGSTKKSLCVEFESLMHKKFQKIEFYRGAHFLLRVAITPKVSHLHAVKRIFRYLKGQPKLGLWYPRDSPFDLEAFSDSDYVGASLDRKSTTEGCQFLSKRLISWQCKKQTVITRFTLRIADPKATEENAEFHQIVDFLTTSSIHYALTVSPTIYASYIEQFWNTANSQTVNDVKQIHATVDGKTVVISESSVRSDLYFKCEDGITCFLQLTAIFENLTLMGYESDSDKLTFQKALFSPQWKYLIHTILHCLSSKSTSWNEFSTNIASAVICLATGQKFNFSKLIFDGMLRNLDNHIQEIINVSRFFTLFFKFIFLLQNLLMILMKHLNNTKKVFTNMKRKGKDFSGRVTPFKDFSGTITPLFASMLVPQVVEGEGSGQPFEPQLPSSTALPSHEEQVTTVASQPQKTHTPTRAKIGRDTEIPQSSGPPKKFGDEDVYTGEDDRVVRVATTATSLEAEQEMDPGAKIPHWGMQMLRLGLRLHLNSPVTHLSKVNTSGSGEDSMKHQDDLMDFVPPTPHDSPLLGGHTPGSDEGRPNINELVAIYTNLSNNVLALEQSKTAQDLRRKSDKKKPMFKDSDFDVLDDAMKNVEGGNTAEQITTAGDTLNTASINVSVAGPSISTTGDIFEDEMTTTADTLMAIRITIPRTTSVVICNVEEEPRRATPVPTVQSQDKGKGKMVEPEPTPKNPRKAQIQMDEELAQRLFEEEQAQFEREQRIARERAAEQEAKDAALIEQMEDVQARMDADELLAARLQEQEREQFSVDEQARFLVETIAARKKFFAAQRAAEIRNRPPTRTQLRNQMITYLKHMGKYTHNQLKSKSFEEIQKLYKKEQQWINDFVPMSDDSGKKHDSSSKQVESIQGDDIAIDVESLATKYPIIDWKTHILTENMMYYQIIKVDGSSKNFKIFSEMFDDFDRQDVMDLHRLVKEMYDTTSPEGYDLLLWGDLKTLFEPTVKRPRSKHEKKSVKKQKLQDDAKKEELKACLDIVQGDDIAIDVESLATKYPIVDWKTHILTENMILVKERYDTTSPEGYDLLLWGDLKTLVEPCEEDEV
ncbi:hypothetical protein Tco_0343584 [Tanacetum coccineum]